MQGNIQTIIWGMGLFGFVVGSFLNVVISRLYTGEPIFYSLGAIREKRHFSFAPRSHCPKCKNVLSWYELIPVISFFLQSGKCRACKKPISWQYPIVEILTALLFILTTSYKLQATSSITSQWFVIAFLFFIASGLIVILVYDIKHYIIPDKVLIPLIVGTVISVLFGIWALNSFLPFNFGIWHFGTLFSALATGFFSAVPFAVMHVASRGRLMGFGDVKLIFFMGLFLGFPDIFVALFLAFISGAIIGIGLIIFGKQTLHSKVPFGPFLIAGTFAALFFSEQLTAWYTNLFI